MDIEFTLAAPQKVKERNILLRRARARRLWSIKETAYRLDVSETTYIRWEQGDQVPHLVNLQALCKTFKATPTQLGFENVVSDEEIDLNGEMEIETVKNMFLDVQRENRELQITNRELRGLQSQLERSLSAEQNKLARERARRESMEERLNKLEEMLSQPTQLSFFADAEKASSVN